QGLPRRDELIFAPMYIMSKEWQHFFRGFEFGFADSTTASEPAKDALQQSIEASEGLLLLEGVQALVQAYRQMGNFVARLDPLGYDRLNGLGIPIRPPRTSPPLEFKQTLRCRVRDGERDPEVT
ncbi:MAG: hypothetical protein OXI58_07340, partial [Gemmatimonadota bacterium]|nr:hypothetical protein [Gemmatimonadota bacterium]